MDNCFLDVVVEFLGVAFHNILYYASIYPKSVFETRKKYSVVVYRSTHPEVNQYIDLCLKSITECLKNDKLNRIEFSLTNNEYDPVVKFMFDFDKNDQFEVTVDAYLVQAEQYFRAFCLGLASISNKFKILPEDVSFTIHLHTHESSAVAIACNPDLEDFPMVEVERKNYGMDVILPLRRFSLKCYNLDTYIEIKT